ncbi:hypothetical protein GF378_00225 [Candidatus Pacearchaeota archaeon]|nr:hypothetical protein [Candidatus Pacearchaeota archaeon]
MADKETKKSKKQGKTKKKMTQAEFEKEVIKMADSGMTCEKIGEKLRQKGIHPKEYKKKISNILKKESKYINPDLKNVEEKLNKIKAHYENNKQDKKAMREKDRIFSQLRKLKKHFGVAIK